MKYKPSINQTVRGLSTSTLNNKVYNSTQSQIQLRVSCRLSKSNNDNILPVILTAKYSESILDLVVSLNTGDKTFLTTFVNNIDLFSFKVEVQNPNSSPAIIQIQESASERKASNSSTINYNLYEATNVINNQKDNNDNTDVNIVFTNGDSTPVITNGNHTINIPV